MRWLLIMLALGAAGTAGYLGTVAKNSFSAYSNEQLDMLEREMSQQLEPNRPSTRPLKSSGKQGQQKESLSGSQELLQQERQRRLYFFAALAVAAVAAVAAFFIRSGGSSIPTLRGSSDEDARLVAAVGDPSVLREGARQKAASLLGVATDAPPAVIEAALQAQLQQRDPARLDGLAPDLKNLALQQREELVRARDLLLNQKPSGPRKT
ncbi:hypothetical protein [Hyalangium versicolor]|uniref:hypothetical protein n=1 Tax=Hyalangium versicolor TaxID=2861190 RepID=UPI001CCF5E95|nr:hypothetical protein [Hyalangium versicolor]